MAGRQAPVRWRPGGRSSDPVMPMSLLAISSSRTCGPTFVDHKGVDGVADTVAEIVAGAQRNCERAGVFTDGRGPGFAPPLLARGAGVSKIAASIDAQR